MKKIIFLFAALIAFGSANAQTSGVTTPGTTVALTIPSVAMIKLSGTVPTFTFVAPATAGDNFADVTSTGTSLQYTSILNGAGAIERAIYVTATANNGIVANKGFNLWVEASAMGSTAGNGTRGNANGQQFIVKSADGLPNMVNTGPTMTFSSSTSNQKLVTGIKSCYTGIAAADGPQLRYTASVGGSLTSPNGTLVTPANFAQLKSGTYTFVVYYTLADNV